MLRICTGDWEKGEEGEQWSSVHFRYNYPHPSDVQALNDTQRQSLLDWLRGEGAMPIDQMGLDLDPALYLPAKCDLGQVKIIWASMFSSIQWRSITIMMPDSEDLMSKCMS